MTLKSDIEEYLEGDDTGVWGITWDVDCEEVLNEITGRSRWSIYTRSIFQRGEEYVEVIWESPATELQEGQDEGAPLIYSVVPRMAMTVIYERVEG